MSTTLVRDIREIVREEPLMHRPILEALAGGPLTVLEIAAAIGHPTRRGPHLDHGDAPLRH